MELIFVPTEIAKIREEKAEIWAEEEVEGTVQKVGEAKESRCFNKSKSGKTGF